MNPVIKRIIIILTVILSYPSISWATRGSEDYGIVMALMVMVFTFPVGLILVGFIVYLIGKLRSRDEPVAKQGRVVYIFSIIILVLSIIIPIFWIFWAENHFKMFELMSGVFMPLILLSIISLVLANSVKKGALNIN